MIGEISPAHDASSGEPSGTVPTNGRPCATSEGLTTVILERCKIKWHLCDESRALYRTQVDSYHGEALQNSLGVELQPVPTADGLLEYGLGWTVRPSRAEAGWARRPESTDLTGHHHAFLSHAHDVIARGI